MKTFKAVDMSVFTKAQTRIRELSYDKNGREVVKVTTLSDASIGGMSLADVTESVKSNPNALVTLGVQSVQKLKEGGDARTTQEYRGKEASDAIAKFAVSIDVTIDDEPELSPEESDSIRSNGRLVNA